MFHEKQEEPRVTVKDWLMAERAGRPGERFQEETSKDGGGV